MKKLLLILLSVILFGCSENRVLIDELTNKGTEESPLMFYESGLFNGIGFNVYENGQLKEEGSYKDGQMIGLWKSLHENSKLKEDGNYKNGEKDGLWKLYNAEGVLISETKYVYGKKEGVLNRYYDNGKLKGTNNYINGEISGISKEYTSEGVLIKETEYKESKEDGITKEYYDNGQIKKETVMKNGKLVKKSGWNKDGSKIKYVKYIKCYDWYDNPSKYLGDIVSFRILYYEKFNLYSYKIGTVDGPSNKYEYASLSGRIGKGYTDDGDKIYKMEGKNCYERYAGCSYDTHLANYTQLYIPIGTPVPRDIRNSVITITGKVFMKPPGNWISKPVILIQSIRR